MIKSRLRHFMADNNINSRSELQRTTGLSRSALNKLFKGETIEGVTVRTLYRICKAYKGAEMTDLIEFHFDDEPEKK